MNCCILFQQTRALEFIFSLLLSFLSPPAGNAAVVFRNNGNMFLKEILEMADFTPARTILNQSMQKNVFFKKQNKTKPSVVQ